MKDSLLFNKARTISFLFGGEGGGGGQAGMF